MSGTAGGGAGSAGAGATGVADAPDPNAGHEPAAEPHAEDRISTAAPGSRAAAPPTTANRAAPPRLGFLGVGWIGHNRMRALVDDGCATVTGVADPSAESLEACRETAPDAARFASLEELLEVDLDGVVIATPSALHAAQATAALERGLAVFCQKPLGRTEAEVRRVVDAARAADRLLGCDMSYRYTRGMQRLREEIAAGALGDVFAADLVFHNAYGPDKDWFYQLESSGGGCMMDLGIHLVDLALWSLDFPEVRKVSATLHADGARLDRPPEGVEDQSVEDHAVAELELASGTTVRIACSWNLPAGRDAVISAEFYGTDGGGALRNVDGSFYEFTAERFDGTSSTLLAEPPDAWGGRALVDWARRLAAGARFEDDVEDALVVARTLDRIYGREGAE